MVEVEEAGWLPSELGAFTPLNTLSAREAGKKLAKARVALV